MRVNVGGIDRIYRVVIGLVLIGLAATGTVGWWGVAPLATAAIGWCPAYTPFGASTCSTKTST